MTLSHQPPIAAGDGATPRALLLAGGGMRVAYQAGAVKALVDAGLRFTHADGASGGTINLAALLSGVSVDDLCDRWRALSVKKFASLRPTADYLRAADLPALGSADNMVQYVYPSLGIDVGRIRAATGIDASFNVCRFDDKTVVPIPHRQLDLARLTAAASLPIFMPAVQAAGSTWTDAVWIKDTNLLACVERGARELWLVWCIGNTPVFHNGAFNQYVHMIEMSAVGALNWELATIADINTRIARGETVLGHREPIVVYVVKPEVPLPLDPDFYFGRIDAATLIDMGYGDACRLLRSMHPAPLDARATQMHAPGTGLSFRETMAGSLTLEGGDSRSDSASTDQFTMHAAIYIDDVAAFIADPEHKADLTGHIDSARFGEAVPAESGLFGLFVPSGDPALTFMMYELGFQHGGMRYYLAGKKRVRVGTLLKLWRETTTLYCTLHEGTDAGGRVLGSGILRLDASELFRLLGTVYATNADDKRTAAGVVWRFFKFFAAELVRTYVRQRPLVTARSA
ncbi:patatin-like phospholipase family protein [Paraburkholderia elongata]|uniref:Patatin-like phospholipase family protein n=1 Tax=Paraburkholderia elongata TaxID=2675747 RepID=A0A972P060_9BURK|nr:patatin-like phospholipase family protein [Paraburkholderia elongata]NPT58190.1 patatin-like phospholipase family protein [Paraburkholderia elongata]NPT62122.1 patatin-like phospholipase family protein [Paraburkholderia elongata]